MTTKIVVTDLDTGDTSEAVIESGNYFIVGDHPCYLESTQTVPGDPEKGEDWDRHILTIAKVGKGKSTTGPRFYGDWDGKKFEGYRGPDPAVGTVPWPDEREQEEDAAAKAEARGEKE